MNRLLIIGLITSIISGCSLLNISGTSGTESDTEEVKYSEDLSIYRETYEIQDKVDTSNSAPDQITFEDPEFDSLNYKLDSIATLNLLKNEYRGYAIQLYSSTNYEEIKKLMGKVVSELDDLDPQLIFQQPNFKIRIGQYNSELEARVVFNKIKRNHPSAIIIPEIFPIAEKD